MREPAENTSASCGDPERSIRAQERFVALWNRIATGGPIPVEAIFVRLSRLYGEAHRRYHTLDHIRHCLEEFDRAKGLIDDPDAVEMGLWFHDAIYRSGARDNEWRSAELFREWSEGFVNPAFGERVRDLILVTTHRAAPAAPDQRYIADIDLSSFGLPWDEFERDGRHIRAEFANVSDEGYYPGHLRFLLSLLDRPTFFLTEHFRRRYERIARANARRVVADLRARGYGVA